jgi:hypothetical protein
MGTFGRTWNLYKQSFYVLSADAEIVLFPVMSAVSAILLAAGFFYPLYLNGTLEAISREKASWEQYALLFLWYYLNSFIVIFFNSALVGCASIRLSGGDPTVRDGLRIAADRLGSIAAWAFVAATVGLVLSSLRDRKNKLVSWLASGLGLAWTLITYLIVPVLILENRSIFESIQRSSELFRKRWGEEVAGSFGFGLLSFLLAVPGLLLGGLLFQIDRALAVIVVIWYVVILAAITSAVKGVFTVALYRYASEGEVPVGFSSALIDGALGGRKSSDWTSGYWPRT